MTLEQWRKLFEVTQALMTSKVEEANEAGALMDEMGEDQGKALAAKGIVSSVRMLVKYIVVNNV